jgi:hypothetical protein
MSRGASPKDWRGLADGRLSNSPATEGGRGVNSESKSSVGAGSIGRAAWALLMSSLLALPAGADATTPC